MAARKMLSAFGLAFILLAVVIVAARAGAGRIKVDPAARAAVTERLRLLDIDYMILQKDDPPQAETLNFRRRMAEAGKDLDAGRLEAATKTVTESEAWMSQARPQFYRRHQSRVAAGTSTESPDQLMDSAFSLMQKGIEAKDRQDQAADRFFAAAVEQGELSLLAAGRSPAAAADLIRLADRMNTVYAAADKPEMALTSRGRVVASLQSSLDGIGRQIQQRLNNQAPGFETATLTDSRDAVETASAELARLDDQYQQVAAIAQNYAPGECRVADYAPNIAAFTRKWRATHEKPPVNNPHENDDPKINEGACMLSLAQHNQLKKDAQSTEGSGIVIEESEVYVQGEAVVIRGKLQNLRNSPILKPRITVTGGIMSKIVDLGYERLNPPLSTTFQLQLECFTVEAYNRSMNKIPDHQLLLIFQEPNGSERKVIQPIGIRAGSQ